MRMLLLSLLTLFSQQLLAQFVLHAECVSCDKKLKLETRFEDSLSIYSYLSDKRFDWWAQGFSEASVDTLHFQGHQATAIIHLGPRYQLAELDMTDIPSILRPSTHSLTGKKKAIFSPIELSQYLRSILAQATQNGYPLADVYLDSIRLTYGRLAAKIRLQKGIFIQYTNPKVLGNTGIKESFIQNYLHLPFGQPFDVSQIKKIKKRVRDLEFMELTAPPNIQFKGNEAIITLVLKEKKANQFNFLIGVLPNTNEDHKLLLVGNVLMDFKNILGYGERLYFKFDQTRPQTQQLALKTAFPYPFKLPIGIDAEFSLYKRDTAYLDVHSQLAVRYFLKNQNYLKLFWQSTSSNLLTINKQSLIVSKKLPANLDYKSQLFGLEYGIAKLDYRFNPRKGWAFRTSAGAGILSYPPNPKITEITLPNDPNFSFAALYDSLGQKTWQLRSELAINGYIPIFRSSVIAIANQTGWQYIPTQTSQNQLFRIGGNQLMRGFNEESIFASFYSVSTLEYRLLIGGTSYLYAFGDYGYTQAPTTKQSFISSDLIGFGAGLSFQTKAGVFRISYALGKQDSNPVDTRSSKIHLGYQSVF